MKITFTKDVLIPDGVQKSGTSLEVDDAMATAIKALGAATDYVEHDPKEDLQTMSVTQDAEETKVETTSTTTKKAAK